MVQPLLFKKSYRLQPHNLDLTDATFVKNHKVYETRHENDIDNDWDSLTHRFPNCGLRIPGGPRRDCLDSPIYLHVYIREELKKNRHHLLRGHQKKIHSRDPQMKEILQKVGHLAIL